MKHNIPTYILEILEKFTGSGFEANIVGGPVRDLLLGKIPFDYDLNTNASPEEIQGLFPDSVYENEFGTVGIKVRGDYIVSNPVSHETQDVDTIVVEVTPYRKEGVYTNGRHPDKVDFKATLQEDLLRRDFTINAIAYNPITDTMSFFDAPNITIKDISLKDMNTESSSIKDIVSSTIRCVGNPLERFSEDFLRMLRAIRFSSQLGFSIEQSTLLAIKSLSSKLSSVSRERVRDEFQKLIMSKDPYAGIKFLEFTGLLEDVMPELLLGKGMKQTVNHKYDVYEHLLLSLKHASDKNYPLHLRLAALLHDIAKPHTAREDKATGWNTFYGHEVVGEKVSREILSRLKFSQDLVSRVTKLVRWHMFNSDPDQVTMSAVRRMIVNVGRENIWDLMNLRFCDRIGSGRPKEEPHRLRRYFAMLEEAMTQPTDLKMLKIDGSKVMEVTRETPGPKIGLILKAIMGEVLEKPELNTESTLVSRVTELSKLSMQELSLMAKKGEEEQEEQNRQKTKSIRKKFKV